MESPIAWKLFRLYTVYGEVCLGRAKKKLDVRFEDDKGRWKLPRDAGLKVGEAYCIHILLPLSALEGSDEYRHPETAM